MVTSLAPMRRALRAMSRAASMCSLASETAPNFRSSFSSPILRTVLATSTATFPPPITTTFFPRSTL